MSEDKSLAHTRWNCRYHIVCIPKCRRKEIYGTVRGDVVAVIKRLCEIKDVEIMERHACIDYTHHLGKNTP